MSDQPRPSVESLRLESFGTRHARLVAAARRHGIDPEGMVLPAEGMFTTDDGADIHYLEWPGPSQELAMIFLHGGGLHAHTFDVAGNLLRQHARCVALDQRGHGESEWTPGRYGSEQCADDIAAAVDRLGLKRVVVVGHSMGGIGAVEWAARNPPELAGLVIVDVGPELTSSATASINDFITSRPSYAGLEDVESDSLAANLRWGDDGRLVSKYDDSQFHSGATALPMDDEMRALGRRIACPTTILRGERSKVLSDEAAASFAAEIDGADWQRVPNAGHTIQSSNPRGLADAVLHFLERVG
jgi:pimeloyl-ACP methyl ester carboxylesterase